MSQAQGEIRISRRTAQFIIILGAILLSIAAIFLGVFAVQRRSSEPDVEVEQPVQDFGDVAFDNTVQAQFTIRNNGGQPLQILGIPQVVVRAGC